MTSFDTILPIASDVLRSQRSFVETLPWLWINRDLNGRVRLIAPTAIGNNDPHVSRQLMELYKELAKRLGPHAYPTDAGVLFEHETESACKGIQSFTLDGFTNVRVLDRLAADSRWETIEKTSDGAPRFVYFSIKGGVGRSTALAACAWHLARQGKRVLVLDLDLESPGLSSALLKKERQPAYGITDWLVEDLVDNGDAVIENMHATSDLTTDGTIFIVPAHGLDPGEYVSKLGRVWMPKVLGANGNQTWSMRLNRLITLLERKHVPDVILIDSRAGIDEVAAACVTDLGAHTIFMFAIQGQQTWTGYQALISHWKQFGVIPLIRDRLQLVAGLVPDDDRRIDYLSALREDAYSVFEDTYDVVGPGDIGDWSFDEGDDNAPHSPIPVRWNRGWYGLLSLQQRMLKVDEGEVTLVYGPLVNFVDRALKTEVST